VSELLPIGIYTIPEISFVGRTEEELTETAVPHEVGISRYRELARGHILGDIHGLRRPSMRGTGSWPLSASSVSRGRLLSAPWGDGGALPELALPDCCDHAP
jgi:hypothetical protein